MSSSTFTDDTVLTSAVADAILNQADYAEKLKEYFGLFPDYRCLLSVASDLQLESVQDGKGL